MSPCVSLSLYLSHVLLSLPTHIYFVISKEIWFYSSLISAQRFVWLEFFTFNYNIRVVSMYGVPTVN